MGLACLPSSHAWLFCLAGLLFLPVSFLGQSASLLLSADDVIEENGISGAKARMKIAHHKASPGPMRRE